MHVGTKCFSKPTQKGMVLLSEFQGSDIDSAGWVLGLCSRPDFRFKAIIEYVLQSQNSFFGSRFEMLGARLMAGRDSGNNLCSASRKGRLTAWEYGMLNIQQDETKTCIYTKHQKLNGPWRGGEPEEFLRASETSRLAGKTHKGIVKSAPAISSQVVCCSDQLNREDDGFCTRLPGHVVPSCRTSFGWNCLMNCTMRTLYESGWSHMGVGVVET